MVHWRIRSAQDITRLWKKPGVQVIVLLCLAYVLFLHGLGTVSLWDPDEPRQAIMAREMIERSDYVHPYLNGQPYLEKPPLYPWLIVLAAQLRGNVDEIASRIPAALSATFLLLVVFFLGRLLKDSESGFLGAVILALNYQFLSNARESVMDMTFALFIALAIYLAYRAIVMKNFGLIALSSVASACAVMTKGPAGIVIPTATIFIYTVIEKRTAKNMLWLAAGFILSALLASIWFVIAGDNYWKEFILRQNLVRYTKGFDHIEPFSYYFRKILVNFLPWSIILPFAVFHAVKKRLVLPLAWFLFTFVFYSLSQSKRAIYLLSCYPACAILCAFYLRALWSRLIEQTTTRWLVRFFAAALLLVPVASAGVVIFAPIREGAFFHESTLRLTLFLLALFLVAVYFFRALVRRLPGRSLIAFCAYLTVAGVFYHACYMRVVDKHFKSPQLILGGEIAGPIYTYGFNSAGLIFYAGRPITTLRDLGHLDDAEQNAVLITDDEALIASDVSLEGAAFSPVKKTQYKNSHFTVYRRIEDMGDRFVDVERRRGG